MLPTNKFTIPGEHPFFFTGRAGQLEAILTVPANLRSPYVAILGHPHSLHGGNMNNKVVTTMARASAEIGIMSLRFNFRGVGLSAGTYDAGKGESEDMLLATQLFLAENSQTRFLLAGFSFGSFVAYLAAQQCVHDLLILVAPPVQHFAFPVEKTPAAAWVILQGDEDEIVPPSSVATFAEHFVPKLPIFYFEKTGHFFHGKLQQLKTTFIEIVQQKVLQL